MKQLDSGKTTLVELKDVYKLIKEGDIQLPLFQRSYKWTNKEKENLLFSMLNRITIGSIILWKSDDPAGNKQEPRKALNNFSSSIIPEYLLLDGQQRFTFLTSLYYSGISNVIDSFIPEFHLNIETNEISSTEFKIKNQRRNKLNNKFQICIQRLIYCDNNEIDSIPNITSEEREKLKEFKITLTNYEIPCYYFVSRRSKALFVYESANMTGKRLKKEDLTEAILTNLCPDLNIEAEKIIAEHQKELPKLKILNKVNIFRIISADIFHTYEAKPRNLGVFKSIKPNKQVLKEKDIKTSLKNTKKSIYFIVKALQNNLHLQNGNFVSLPSLVISTLIFNKYKNDIEKSMVDLGKWMRWIILSNKNKHYTGGATNSKVDKEILIIKSSKNLTDMWNQLDNAMKANSSNEDALNFSRDNFAYIDDIKNKKDIYTGVLKSNAEESIFWMLQIACAKSQAQDWFTEDFINKNNQELHHIWPKASFKKSNCQHYAYLIEHPANKAFISRRSNKIILSKNFDDYIDKLKHKKVELEKQAVFNPPKKKNKTLSPGNDSFFDYCQKRSEALIKLFNEILNKFKVGEIKNFKSRNQWEMDIENGENSYIEFKETILWDTKNNQINEILQFEIKKSINAFGNTEGGTLYIGVNDSKAIIGIERDLAIPKFKSDVDLYQRYLISLAKRSSSKSNITGMYPFNVYQIDHNGLKIFAVRVYPFDDNRTKIQMTKSEKKNFNLKQDETFYCQRIGNTSEKNIIKE